MKQTRWVERKFEFNFPVGLFPIILERLRGTIPQVIKLIENVSDEMLSRNDGESWSIKQQIGHLADLEELWYGRIEDFLAKKETLRTWDVTNAKTHNADHNSKKIRQLIEEFSSARLRLIQKVENFDEATVLLTAIHPRLQISMRLIDSLFFVAEHDDHHLAKIRELLVVDTR